MIERLATAAGYLARLLLALIRLSIRASGPLLVIYGVWLIYPPAAFIVGGLVISGLVLFLSIPNGGSK